MKYLKLIAVISLLIIMNGCQSDNAPDINELVSLLNERGAFMISDDDIIITKTQTVEYNCFIDNTVLLKAYADNENKIICCTITEANNKLSNALLRELCVCLCVATDEESENIVKSLSSTPQKVNGWNILRNHNDTATFTVICRDSFDLKQNNLPTLKDTLK